MQDTIWNYSPSEKPGTSQLDEEKTVHRHRGQDNTDVEMTWDNQQPSYGANGPASNSTTLEKSDKTKRQQMMSMYKEELDRNCRTGKKNNYQNLRCIRWDREWQWREKWCGEDRESFRNHVTRSQKCREQRKGIVDLGLLWFWLKAFKDENKWL